MKLINNAKIKIIRNYSFNKFQVLKLYLEIM